MDTIPLLDLEAQYRSLEHEIQGAIHRVMRSQRFILGPEVQAFEREMADYTGCKHAIGLSSGTDAILVALMALGVGPGDEVVTTPYTFVATITSIARLGARARFVDIDRSTFNIDAAKIEAAITDKTKCIVPVHLFGQMADMKAILPIAKERGLPVIEDAAQAIGASRGGIRVGTRSAGATLSFFPSKNLGGIGDGGMFITNEDEIADKIRLLRNHGQSPKYFSRIVGGNFRLDEVQAAVLRVKLRHLDAWTEARRKNAEHYRRSFGARNVPRIVLPVVADDAHHVFNQFVVRTSDRDDLKAHLAAHRVGAEVYYPQPMHLQACFASWNGRVNDFPEAEAAARETLALPIFPELGEERIERVVDLVSSFMQSRS